MGNQESIQHFGVRIKKSEKNKLSRENYAIIDKRSSIWTPSTPSRYSDPEKRRKYFEDEECRVYSDSYCEEHQEKCLINFDKNMEFFKQIPKAEFEVALQKLVGSNKKLKQVFDLNDCKEMRGIYILVLDEYKQIYIGQAVDIKRRIMQHWSKQKQFDRLIFGNVNNSVLSIDSFGALDTTRIYVLETDRLDSFERLVVKNFPAHLKLNRIGGGTISDNLDVLIALSEWNLRSLKECHSEEFAEKYEKEMDVTYFEFNGYCALEELAKGDIICLEKTERGKLLPAKYYGEVIRATKSRLLVYKYCGPILVNSYYSSKFKDKKLCPEEIRVKKTMLFSKVDMVEKKEIHTFWKSKKFPHLEA